MLALTEKEILAQRIVVSVKKCFGREGKRGIQQKTKQLNPKLMNLILKK